MISALRAAIEKIPTREERLGGQTFKYVKLSEVLDLLDTFRSSNADETTVCNWLRTNRRDGQPSAFVEANCGVSFRVQIGTVSEYRFCPSCGKRTVLQGSSEEPSELPEALRDPVKNLERGRELLKEWGPTPVTDAALAESKESPLARAVRIARGDTGPPPEPVRFAEKASEPFEKHPDYCMAHGGHLVDSPACKLAREREKRTENGTSKQT